MARFGDHSKFIHTMQNSNTDHTPILHAIKSGILPLAISTTHIILSTKFIIFAMIIFNCSFLPDVL